MNNIILRITLLLAIFIATSNPMSAAADPLADPTAGNGEVTVACVNNGRAELFFDSLRKRIKDQLKNSDSITVDAVRVHKIKIFKAAVPKKKKDITAGITVTIDPTADNKVSLSGTPVFSTLYEECGPLTVKYRVVIVYHAKNGDSSVKTVITQVNTATVPAAFL